MTEDEARRIAEYTSARNTLVGPDEDAASFVDATAYRILQAGQAGNLTPAQLAEAAAAHVGRVATRYKQGSNAVSEEIMEAMKSAHEQTKKGRAE
jgi:hypothetical protein